MPSFAVIITALDETWSLRETVERIIADNGGDIGEILMATAPHSTPGCRAAVDEMRAAYPGLVKEHTQKRLPGLGGALQECAQIARGDWIIFMSSDLETDPATVKDLIARAKQGDADIVATSRWLSGGSFGDYSRVKLVCNWIFQFFFSRLYNARLTDMTFGFRAYPAALLRRYEWRETGHAWFMESLVKPLRDGKRVAEIPTRWRKRQEGESHINPSEFARYFRVGFYYRFVRKAAFIQTGEKP